MMATISTNFGDGMLDFEVTTGYKLSGTQAKNWIEHFGLNGVNVRIDIFVGCLLRAAPIFLVLRMNSLEFLGPSSSDSYHIVEHMISLGVFRELPSGSWFFPGEPF